LLLESASGADGKVVIEIRGTIRMARGAERKCSSMELNGLVQVIHDVPLLESVKEAVTKVEKRHGPVLMVRRTLHRCFLTLLHIICCVIVTT